MDPGTLINAIYALAAVMGELWEDHHDQAVTLLPASLPDQLRWTRTLQLAGRDSDQLCEAMAVMLRRLEWAQRDWTP